MPSPAPTAPAVGFEHRLADAIARRISEPRVQPVVPRPHPVRPRRRRRRGRGAQPVLPRLAAKDVRGRRAGRRGRGARGARRPSGSPSTRSCSRPSARPRRSSRTARGDGGARGGTGPSGRRARSRKRPRETAAAHRRSPPAVGGRWPTSWWGSATGWPTPRPRASSRSRGGRANPLVIYGPIGTGKTHLLEGIYAGLQAAAPTSGRATSSAEDFMNRFVAGHRGRASMASFRRQFRECSRPARRRPELPGQQEGAPRSSSCTPSTPCVADGRQVVVTGDCHPRLADDLMPELADRLLGGAVWGAAPARPGDAAGHPAQEGGRRRGRRSRRRAPVPGEQPARQRAGAGRGGQQPAALRAA